MSPGARLATIVAAGALALVVSSACTSSARPMDDRSRSPLRSADSAAEGLATLPGTESDGSDRASAPGPRASRAGTSGGPRQPVIVIDPGHSPALRAIDPSTGLNVSDYENEPEMRDVFAVALLVRAHLTASGYRVVLTKRSARSRVSLAQRAAIANRVHADLALSIHDQAGAGDGIGFAIGNNTVYYQSVGDYRVSTTGERIRFADRSVAAVSKRYAELFGLERARIQRTHVSVRGHVGYDLASRGLPGGSIWIVQLLARVPWLYNEAGGNSAGRVGLNAADRRRYADALVAGVERCVPVRR